MELNDLLRVAAITFVGVALASVPVIVLAVLRARGARSPATRSASAAPTVRSAPRETPVPPRSRPQLADEDTEALGAEERLIKTAANTLKGLPQDVQDALWAACVPHDFDRALLGALLPEARGRLANLFDSVQHVWFVEVTPGGRYHLQTPIRRTMIRHLSKPAEHEHYLNLSRRAAKFFHQALLGRATRGRWVSETFFRFLPDLDAWPADQIEWLYHLAVVDPDNAARALRQVGDHWLVEQIVEVERLVDELSEHVEDGRVAGQLRALIYYYQGQVALRHRRSAEALDLLEKARQDATEDMRLRDAILKAMGIGLQDLHAVQGAQPGRTEVAARPTPARRQWVMWDEMQLPDPRQDLITRYQEQLALYRAAQYRDGMGRMMMLIAEEHVFRADYRAAVQWYQDALKVYQDLAASSGRPLLDEVMTLKALGDVHCALRHYPEARQHYQAALDRLKDVAGDGAPLHRADLLKSSADVLRLVGKHDEALPQYESAREIYQEEGALSSAADALLAEGEAFYAQGNSSEAQQHFDEALQTYRKAGSQTGRAQTLLVLGGMTQERGQYSDALQQYEQAREIYRAEKSLSGEASALRAMGDAHARLTEWDKALEAYRSAIGYYQAAGARTGRAHTLAAMGDVYRLQQQFASAWEQYERALNEYRTLHDVVGEANALVKMGVVHSLQQHSAEALKLFDEAETLYRQGSERPGEAQARRFKGEEYLLEKQFDLALTEFDEAIKAYEDCGGYGEAVEELWGRLGHTYAMLQRRAEALQAYDRASNARSRLEPGWHGFRALVDGQFDAADAHFKVIARRDQDNVQWFIGLALAKFGLAGDQPDAALRRPIVKEAAQIVADKLQAVNVAERAEACRWRDYVKDLRPVLAEHWGELGLKCE